jgi:hypothetical protein
MSAPYAKMRKNPVVENHGFAAPKMESCAILSIWPPPIVIKYIFYFTFYAFD